MNVLINFRYLTGDGINRYIFNEVIDSNELEEIVNDFRFYADGLRATEDGIDNYFLEKNGSINDTRVKNVKADVEEICNKRIEQYNRKLERGAYLFLDEICTVFIKKGKAIPMEDPHEYVNFKDVKRLIQEAILNIASHEKGFDFLTYTNVMYLIYIDIIEKDAPLLIWQNQK